MATPSSPADRTPETCSAAQALAYYQAARDQVHHAFDARDRPRLEHALQIEAMWERIYESKTRQGRTTSPDLQPILR